MKGDVSTTVTDSTKIGKGFFTTTEESRDGAIAAFLFPSIRTDEGVGEARDQGARGDAPVTVNPPETIEQSA